MEDLWLRFENWLQANAPQLLAELNAGATETELNNLAMTIGAALPAEFLAFYRIHNGQQSCLSGMFDGEELLSVARMLGEWTIWYDILTSGDFANAYSEPAAGVRADWWHPLWLPLTYDGAGNHYCLDLAPAPGGTPGQIIRMWHDAGERPLVATSFTEWFTQYVTGLEAGKYAFSEDYDGIVAVRDLGEK